MKRGLSIFFLFIFFSGMLMAQSGKRGITPRLNAAPSNLSDSLLLNPDSSLISTNRTTAYRLTEKLGERYIAPMDTGRLNFANSTMMDGRGLAVSYLGNIGSPAQSRIFSERDHNENDFIYANAYNYYITTPTNALFYDVKDPYTRITYLPHLFGDKTMSEEMLNGVMTTNFGKKINIGTDFDYTYVRGHYASNADKMLYYRFFGSYLSDRYEMHAYFRNHNYLNTENGGITDDRYVTHPDDFTDGKRKVTTKDYPTRFTNTWNRVKGKQFFLTHRYNLGFYREMTIQEKEENEKKKEAKIKRDELLRQEAEMHEHTDEHPNESEQSPGMPNLFSGEPGENPDEEEDIDAIFVPVSSIIHTFEYEGSSRRFVSNSTAIDTCYNDIYTSLDSAKNDFTEAWHVKNTIGLSLREGFQDWAKFGLTAYINFDKRRFTLPTDSGLLTESYDEFSTYLGAELSKQQGRLLTYKARGEFCLVGDDIGEFRVEGDLKTQFRLMGKDASVKASGYIKNMTPAFYTRHHHSRYFWWDQSFKNIQRVYAGGEIDLQQTRTKISAGVESIQNYIFFGNTGMPEQYGSNLQVINARIKQDFRYKAFGWENEVAYQLSSEKNVLPLPQISAYSNIYIDFAYAKVLKIQLGADAHYYTSYYAPYYEPATQQFQNQHEKKIGNYPIINAYANFRLKQARFFISGYNVGSLFITPSKHFSLLHYPVNPMMIKLGISVYFNN